MSDDDILAQLRDIHLPTDLATTLGRDFALWPFIVLACIVAAIVLTRLWLARRWRRRAKANLTQILDIKEPATRWHKLLTFADGLSSISGRPVSLPDTVYLRPETVTDEQRSAFVAFLHAELRR